MRERDSDDAGKAATAETADAVRGEPAGTMRALAHDRYGPPDVLAVARRPVPVPGPSDVLVRVRAAGLDRGTWHLVAGEPYLIRPVSGLRRPRQPVPGLDLAGVVEAVGAEVAGLRPGDEVYGTGRGALAEYALADPDKLAPKPAALTFAQAASVPVSAQTALHALRDQGGVRPGQHVLVLGASGGVGTFAVQLARAMGARVTGVCSTSKVDLVERLGVDEVLDYTTTDPTDGRVRYDVIVDIGGNRPLRALRRALTPRGTLVIVGGEGGGRWIGGIDRQVRAVLWSPFLKQRLRMFVAPERREDLEALSEYLEAGEVTPVVEQVVPLEQAPHELQRLRDGLVRGKVVVDLAGA